MNSITLSKELKMKKEYDVIVTGGGVAGVAAAISAANNGKSTLLVEKSTILGGLATLGLINLFVPLCNGRGKQIIFGLCDKWVKEASLYGYDTIPSLWKNGEPNEPTLKRYTNRFPPYIFALQMTEDLLASGAELLYDSVATEPVMDGNRCVGVVTHSKSGMEFYGCKMLIDTTGDLDVMRSAGVPHTAGENFATYSCKQISLDGCKKAAESGNIRDAYSSIGGYGASLWGDRQPEGVPKWSGLTAEEVTDYLVTNQMVMLEKLKATESERNSRDVAMIPHMPQFRTTCHLNGDYTFTVADAYRHFDDSVCAINDFEHRDYLYEVPLRALTRRDYPNMATAGRSASASGYGWDVIRVIPPAIITGQAAAEAACQAIDEGCAIADVDIRRLQAKLESENVMVHFPDEYVPDDRTVIIHGKNAAEIEGGHL
ncbi:MAG: FAD-dependent oxidoreductase [Clostridia bacterium]|nr:FAD-dependent oxidoreductase [Clostridia bacterium]